MGNAEKCNDAYLIALQARQDSLAILHQLTRAMEGFMAEAKAWFIEDDTGIWPVGPFSDRIAAQSICCEFQAGRPVFLTYDDPTIPDASEHVAPEPQEMTNAWADRMAREA